MWIERFCLWYRRWFNALNNRQSRITKVTKHAGEGLVIKRGFEGAGELK
jgi:hypothetical protein